MVAPASVTLGAFLTIAEVLGANFNGSAQLLVDGQPTGYTTLVNPGILQVTLADSVSATLGNHQFTVQQNTGTSNAAPFTVYAPQPVYPTNEVAMFLNQPGGQFTLSYFVSGPGAFAMRVGDLNRNGKLDIVLET